jgi:hypothetical protein
MAKANGDPNQPLFPRLGQNNQGAFERSTPRHMMNKTNSIRNDHQKQRSKNKD